MHVDYEKCDQCGTCIAVCPCDALVLIERLEIISENCSSCGKCVAVCPFEAIRTEAKEGTP